MAGIKLVVLFVLLFASFCYSQFTYEYVYTYATDCTSFISNIDIYQLGTCQQYTSGYAIQYCDEEKQVLMTSHCGKDSTCTHCTNSSIKANSCQHNQEFTFYSFNCSSLSLSLPNTWVSASYSDDGCKGNMTHASFTKDKVCEIVSDGSSYFTCDQKHVYQWFCNDTSCSAGCRKTVSSDVGCHSDGDGESTLIACNM